MTEVPTIITIAFGSGAILAMVGLCILGWVDGLVDEDYEE